MKRYILISILYCFALTYSLAEQDTLLVNLYFATDSISISHTEKDKLVKFVEEIQVESITEISVLAYCDDIGSKRYRSEECRVGKECKRRVEQGD